MSGSKKKRPLSPQEIARRKEAAEKQILINTARASFADPGDMNLSEAVVRW